MGRDSAFPEGFHITIENMVALGRDKLIMMQRDLVFRISNVSRMYPAGSAREEGYKFELRMISQALKELEKIEGPIPVRRIKYKSREYIAEQLITTRIDAVRYRSDEGGPNPETTRFYLEKEWEAERLAKELEEMGYPLTDKEMEEAKARIEFREKRSHLGIHERIIMEICPYCKASIYSKCVYCSFCGNLIGDLPEHFVFVSYGSNDKEYVESIIVELKKRNIDAWFDSYELKPGMSIQDEINKALEKNKVFLFFASCETLKKEWPISELKTAVSRRMSDPDEIRIIPILLDDCKNEIPPLLTDTKYLAFFDEDEQVDLDSGKGNRLLSELEDAIISFRPKKQS